MKLAIIVPAYNEEKHIMDVVRRLKKEGFSNVIVADDGSKDNTSALAKKAGATVISHKVNLGKGAAMKTGADYAVKNGANALLFVDGDGQHHPEELGRFVTALKTHDIVFGYRKRSKEMPVVLRFGNWFISSLIKTLYGMDLYDSQCGLRAMTSKAYQGIRWKSRDYSVESEMIASAGKQHLRYAQFEISTVYHDKYKGTTPLDGFPIVWKLFWWRFQR